MSNDTKERVEQIISLYIGGAGLATSVLHEEFLIIPRDELPAASLDAQGNVNVEGISHSVWPATRATATRAYRDALDYLSAAMAIEKCLPSQLDLRREELARDLSPMVGATFAELSITSKNAIDRIIALESK